MSRKTRLALSESWFTLRTFEDYEEGVGRSGSCEGIAVVRSSRVLVLVEEMEEATELGPFFAVCMSSFIFFKIRFRTRG
jgi:hypothetical protein